MELNPVITEVTTAATDFLMAICALLAIYFIRRHSDKDRQRIRLWMWVFGLLAFSGILAMIAHGIKMSRETNILLWLPLNLSLGLMIALFIVVALRDIWGTQTTGKALPVMIAIAVIFFVITLIWEVFLVFIIYEAIAMLFALVGYLWLRLVKKIAGAGWLAAGILLTMVAAAAQTNTLSITIIWPIDHNGIYHLIQIVAIIVIAIGIDKTSRTNSPSRR